jgi:hypothetical protein
MIPDSHRGFVYYKAVIAFFDRFAGDRANNYLNI